MDPRLMALQEAMSGMPPGGGPGMPEMGPEMPAPEAMTPEAGSDPVAQAMELLAPMAESNELIKEALSLLEAAAGGPSEMSEDTEQDQAPQADEE